MAYVDLEDLTLMNVAYEETFYANLFLLITKWRAIAAKNHQHLINQRNLQSTNESCNQLMRY